jgi:ABC-2 type transport system ATP-binding protein
MQQVAEHAVFMENISSLEHLTESGENGRPVLSGISLLLKRGEAWGLTGPSLLEIKLLLEIMANIRPYDRGRCVLVEQGMPRNKRIILKHVFYIGTSEMIYHQMNVLEFLMFAAAKRKMDKVDLQEEFLELLVEIGLSRLVLTPVSLLTPEEKTLILLVAAAYSESLLIVLNLPEYRFTETLADALGKIAGLIREKRKALVLGTQDCRLIEKACSHTAVLKDGKLVYNGTVEHFRRTYDQITVIVRDKNPAIVQDRLRTLLPDHKLMLKDGSLMISSPGEDNPGYIYRQIIAAGLTPELLQINPKTVQNAYEELILRHDLPEQLF